MLFWHLKKQSPMQFLISRDLTFNVSPGCEGNVSSVACAHLHSFPKLKSSQIPMEPKCFYLHFVYQGSLKFIFVKLFSMNYYFNKQKRTLQIWVKLSLFYPSLTGSYDNIWPKFPGNFLVENLIKFWNSQNIYWLIMTSLCKRQKLEMDVFVFHGIYFT